MIQTEFYMERKDGVKLYRTYSDQNMMIQKDGTEEMYTEAIDVDGALYTYTETNIPLEHDERYTEAEKAQAYDIIVGN